MIKWSSMSLIRYAVAYVFLASAILKLMVPNFAITFANYGLPYPSVTVLLVAILEIVCAVLLLLNYYVKKATIPLLVIMIMALLVTKVPSLHVGFFQFAFEARLDILMIVLLYVLWKEH
ncbi:DoxX family protein [Aquibacillus salsiterrae]|uniref:DoxX family protein n=1 Tax=Aquibacillus salsiterrae TaxID=2950439 RepID=A0A9X3WJC1_9BACI|nr:DoxX family protein [Aquibacillus salsiterrae]MDC3418484.1 DoxX family protein [Aquibacillus salsiterrae]